MLKKESPSDLFNIRHHSMWTIDLQEEDVFVRKLSHVYLNNSDVFAILDDVYDSFPLSY